MYVIHKHKAHKEKNKCLLCKNNICFSDGLYCCLTCENLYYFINTRISKNRWHTKSIIIADRN